MTSLSDLKIVEVCTLSRVGHGVKPLVEVGRKKKHRDKMLQTYRKYAKIGSFPKPPNSASSFGIRANVYAAKMKLR